MKLTFIIRRFFASYIDAFIIMVSSIMVYIAICLSKGQSVENIENIPFDVMQLFSIIIYLTYFMLMEFSYGKTIGKLALRLEISGLDKTKGSKRLLSVILRTLIRLFPLDPFSIFLDDEGRMWHDKISKTKVIDLRKKPHLNVS
jgi:uncharacterized RDD family membrane protein YckC